MLFDLVSSEDGRNKMRLVGPLVFPWGRGFAGSRARPWYRVNRGGVLDPEPEEMSLGC